MEGTSEERGVSFDRNEGDMVEIGNKKGNATYIMTAFKGIHEPPTHSRNSVLVIPQRNKRRSSVSIREEMEGGEQLTTTRHVSIRAAISDGVARRRC